MDYTILLAKMFGLYFIAFGIALLLKQKELKATIAEMTENKHITLIAGMMLFVVGGLVVFTHNIWDDTLTVLVSLFGWLVFIKGIAYLIMPTASVKKLTRTMNPSLWLGWGGIVSLVIGLYMAGRAFGWF